jgi:(4-(4-[2-(gamma-L-glutamylamino)ethyl]phenoxymethyl)furan-2-yl)methanamine synthase
MPSVIGWDIGGANLKAARAQDGVIVAVAQRPCAPHLGLASIEMALREAVALLGPAEVHAVTMTAELSDAFADRARGVAQISAICANELGRSNLVFYAGAHGFVSRALAAENASAIASANWRASAELVARGCAETLFVDIGSTTTDIIPIEEHAIAAQGKDDASRLACGELVYTGLLRGNPAAGLAFAPIGGRWTQLVDEQFATMSDVHRLLGNIPPDADTAPTVDGRPKTLEASRARLARLLGCDAEDYAPEAWDALAAFFARAQLRRIEDQIALMVSRAPALAQTNLVGAGVGRGVIAAWARREDRAYVDFGAFLPVAPNLVGAADCAPACAVALLAGEPAAGRIP